jgi:hypothetical protein
VAADIGRGIRNSAIVSSPIVCARSDAGTLPNGSRNGAQRPQVDNSTPRRSASGVRDRNARLLHRLRLRPVPKSRRVVTQKVALQKNLWGADL